MSIISDDNLMPDLLRRQSSDPRSGSTVETKSRAANPFDRWTATGPATIMAAVRHRLPENRAGRWTATLAVLSTLACAVLVLAAFHSQGRPGATPWVAAPPAAAAPRAATPSADPAPTAASPSVSARRPATADVGATRSSSSRRASPHAAERKTTKPAPAKSPAKSRHAGGTGMIGSIIGLIGRLLGRGHHGHGRGR
jgi:hypothetical protein